MKTPTTVITGFLGAGKTTIITGLIKFLISQGQKPAYVKNEIGETDLDARIMGGDNILAREILGGCICCTFVGPFLAAIDELIDTYHPDRIIIESSGTADPATLALMVSSHPKLIRDGVLTIIDVINFNGYKNLDYISQEQAKLTDLVVFNKVELVDITRKQAVVGFIRELNTYSPIVEAVNGTLDPDVAFGLTTKELDSLLKNNPHRSLHVSTHEEKIHAFTISPKQFSSEIEFSELLTHLPHNVLRVKGVIRIEETLKIANAMYQRVTFENYKGNEQPFLIIIGYMIGENREEIVKILEH